LKINKEKAETQDLPIDINRGSEHIDVSEESKKIEQTIEEIKIPVTLKEKRKYFLFHNL